MLPKICRNFPRIRRNFLEFKIPTHPGRIRDASGRIRKYPGRIRNRYQLRRGLHLAKPDPLLAPAAPLGQRPLSATIPSTASSKACWSVVIELTSSACQENKMTPA